MSSGHARSNVVWLASFLVMTALSATAQTTRVSVTTVSAENILEDVSLVGTVVASRRATVSVEIAGRVEEVAVALGDEVEADGLLVQFDDMLERLSLAGVEAAERADVTRRDEAVRRLEDAQELVSRQSLPLNELRRLESAVQEAEAILAQERAEIMQRRERISRYSVRAPFAGTVVERRIEVGEWVEPGDAVVDLVATDSLVVDLAVPQRLYSRIDPETAVTLAFEALPGLEFEARVLARVPISDPTSRTFRLRVEPIGDALDVAPGMSANATLGLEGDTAAVAVPQDAILRDANGRTTVFVVVESDEEQIAEERRIALDAQVTGGTAYAVEGLEEGLLVVTRGNEGLSDGDPVEVIETTESES